MLKKIYKLVMGLVQKQQTNNTQNTIPSDELTSQEVEFLILLIKQSSFKGDLVEIVYNTTLKLQNQYLKQTK
jgi:hypothetical protein